MFESLFLHYLPISKRKTATKYDLSNERHAPHIERKGREGANHRRTEREAAGVTFRRGLAYQGRLRGLRLSAFTVAVHKSRVCVL